MNNQPIDTTNNSVKVDVLEEGHSDQTEKENSIGVGDPSSSSPSPSCQTKANRKSFLDKEESSSQNVNQQPVDSPLFPSQEQEGEIEIAANANAIAIAKQDSIRESGSSPSSTSVLVSPSCCSVSSNEEPANKPKKVEVGGEGEGKHETKKPIPVSLPVHASDTIADIKSEGFKGSGDKVATETELRTTKVKTSQMTPAAAATSLSTSLATAAPTPTPTSTPKVTLIEPIQNMSNAKPQKKQMRRPIARKRSNSVPSYSMIGTSELSTSSTAHSPSKGNLLRRGKWTVEEETYVARVIQDFNNGYLKAPAGTTLRTYLSDKLNCDPMRITKKFTGDACIGKRVFHPAVRCPTNASAIDKVQSELDSLERRWRRRLDMQKRDAEKKQAASVAASTAAAAAAAASAPHLHDPTSALIRLNASALPGNRVVVTRTASWLDRANAILSKRRSVAESLSKKAKKEESTTKEMQEVERLIEEGPIIQESSGLLLQKFSTPQSHQEFLSKRKISDDEDNSTLKYPTEARIDAITADNHTKNGKRLRKSLSAGNLEDASSQIRTDFNLSSIEAEDAASFIGFISSVREEAASSSGPSSK
mmetsp:Transcript_22665/g.33570  ORF Transcript_22665/g.33570 Transcript_22665/m.33570 type:complete len:591 (+) Transcript_22665:384-2156(+)